MNKRGIGIVTIVYWVGAFIVLWVLAIGPMLNRFVFQGIQINNLQGLEAFFLKYANMWVLFALLIGILVYAGFRNNAQ